MTVDSTNRTVAGFIAAAIAIILYSWFSKSDWFLPAIVLLVVSPIDILVSRVRTSLGGNHAR
jgi:hypothetical protein